MGPHALIYAALFSLVLLLIPAAAAAASAASDVILKPLQPGAPNTIGLLFIQGADIAAEAYIPITSTLQAALSTTYGVEAWVGIPHFLGDIAEPLVVNAGMSRVLKAMQAQGLAASAPLFVAGHSLGGISAQLYSIEHKDSVRGAVLLGAFLLRTYLANGTMPVPTLTVGGELDGLSRITRIAESFYHQIVAPRGAFARNSTLDYPVTAVLGMSHMQFASGTPPPNVVKHDLQPEISYDAAHRAAALDMAAFLATHVVGPHAADAAAALQERVQQTGEFFAPILAGFEMEGSYHLKPPCYDNPASDACWLGCPWTKIAAVIMGGVSRPGLSFNVTDGFHVVSDVHPIHLPHVLNNCTDTTEACVLQMVTVSQNMYDPLDATDTGLNPVSAYEIRAKLKSRQTVYEHAGLTPADFNVTDAPSLCAEINKHAFTWATNVSGAASLARYQRIGEEYVYGEDLGPYNAGPLWIGAPVVYTEIKNNATGQLEMQVRSPMMKTPTKYVVPAAAGMHYCKLLSPSRVLEWIYVDGLRLHGSINATLAL